MNLTLQTTILSAIFAIAGIIITQLYVRNGNLRAELKSDKQKLYGEFILFLFKTIREEFDDSNQITNELKGYFPKLLTFASDEVIKNTGDFMQHFYNPKADGNQQSIRALELVGDLILSIRNDLGHKRLKSFMKWHDITRVWIRDIDIFIPKNQRTPRGSHKGPSPSTSNKKGIEKG